MPALVLDTGPLVAYLYPRDAYHDWAVDQFRANDPPFLTCEPVLTEVCFLVARNRQTPTRVLDMLARGVLQIGFDLQDELLAIRASMERYADVPMSLADACLVRLAEARRLPVCTLDSDFAIYRTQRGRPLELISPYHRHGLHEP